MNVEDEDKKKELLVLTAQHILNAVRHERHVGRSFELVVADAKRKAERLAGRRRMP